VQPGDEVRAGSGGYLIGTMGNFEVSPHGFIGTVVSLPNGLTPIRGNWIALVATDSRTGEDVPLAVQDHYLPGFVPRVGGLPDMTDPRW
jgi:hypothetical protein